MEAKGLSDIPKSTQHSVSKRDYRLPPPGVVEDIPYALQVRTPSVTFIKKRNVNRIEKHYSYKKWLQDVIILDLPIMKKNNIILIFILSPV